MKIEYAGMYIEKLITLGFSLLECYTAFNIGVWPGSSISELRSYTVGCLYIELNKRLLVVAAGRLFFVFNCMTVQRY